MSNCAFCDRLDRGEYFKTEEQIVVAFEPLNPVTPGHMLFLPVEHVDHAAQRPWITGVTMEAASIYAGRREEEFNLITSAGPVATQTIHHLHIHYVPRREGDGLHLPWTGQSPLGAVLAVGVAVTEKDQP